jgi:hypothetical protein
MSKYDWDPPKDLMQPAADAVSDAKRRLTNSLKQWRNVLFLLAIILLDILRRFVVLGFDPTHIKEAAFSAAITSMATLFAYYVFFPTGKQARRTYESYTEITERLKGVLKRLRGGGLIDAFRRHCRELSRREEDDIKKAQREALKNRYLSDEDIEEYSKLSKKGLKKLVKNGTVNEETKKLIRVYQKPVHCKPYSPTYFMAGLSQKREDAYLHGEDSWEKRTLAMRPVLTVGIAVVTSAITRSAVTQSETALEILFSIAMSVFQILLASFMGYCAGQTAAEREELATLAKACFVEEFLEDKDIVTEADEKCANVQKTEKDAD